MIYSKPATISPGLIYFRKRFLMGLYKGGGAYIRGANTWTIFCVSNKARHKQVLVSHKQENKYVLQLISYNFSTNVANFVPNFVVKFKSSY